MESFLGARHFSILDFYLLCSQLELWCTCPHSRSEISIAVSLLRPCATGTYVFLPLLYPMQKFSRIEVSDHFIARHTCRIRCRLTCTSEVMGSGVSLYTDASKSTPKNFTVYVGVNVLKLHVVSEGLQINLNHFTQLHSHLDFFFSPLEISADSIP